MSFLFRFCQGSWLIVIYWEWLVSIQVICYAKKKSLALFRQSFGSLCSWCGFRSIAQKQWMWEIGNRVQQHQISETLLCLAIVSATAFLNRDAEPSKFVALDSVIVNAEIAREYNKWRFDISTPYKTVGSGQGRRHDFRGGGRIVGSGQPTPHGRRKRGGTEGSRPLNLGGDVPLQILEWSGPNPAPFPILRNFGGSLATCRRFAPPPLENPWRRPCYPENTLKIGKDNGFGPLHSQNLGWRPLPNFHCGETRPSQGRRRRGFLTPALLKTGEVDPPPPPRFENEWPKSDVFFYF